MTVPRQVLPASFYMLTRRTTQRQFLLRPDPAMNNAFLYCVAEAAQRFRLDLILPQQMSNHHHTNLFDRFGNIIEFTEHFHKMLAKCGNSLRGRWENFWSSESPCILQLVDRADVLDKVVYAATNPVKDHLVENVSHWPGANVLGALLNQRPIEVRRPRHFFRDDGPMPASVTLNLTVPAELGDRDEFLREVRERVTDVESRHARDRLQTGRRILGRRCVLRESWRNSPTSREPRRNLRPRVAARCRWRRLEALRRNLDFVQAYRTARTAWLAGAPVPFPAGTYWLRRFVGVPVVGAPIITEPILTHHN